MRMEFKAGTDPGVFMLEVGERALALAAEYALEQANRTVPHEEGTLQRSGRTSVSDSGLTAAISYDTPYAVRQHEDLTARHDEGRRAKWLELTLQEQSEQIAQIIADTIKGEM